MSVDANDRSPGPDESNRTIGVLISGRGSNLQALIDAVADGQLDARIAIVISNRASAAGLTRAAGAGIETLVIDHRSFPSRDEFDRAVAQELLSRGVRLVCLAGFMRLVGAPLIDAFPKAILTRRTCTPNTASCLPMPYFRQVESTGLETLSNGSGIVL